MARRLQLPTDNPDIVLINRTTIEEDEALFALFEENREHLREPTDNEEDLDFFPTLESVTQARIDNPYMLRMGIWYKRDTMVGEIVSVRPGIRNESEIGYMLREDATGNGYATMAVRALTEHLIGEYERIIARTHIENTRSIRVLERAGYVEASRGQDGVLVYERKNPNYESSDPDRSVSQIMGYLARELGIEL